jgi:hypothetical protein
MAVDERLSLLPLAAAVFAEASSPGSVRHRLSARRRRCREIAPRLAGFDLTKRERRWLPTSRFTPYLSHRAGSSCSDDDSEIGRLHNEISVPHEYLDQGINIIGIEYAAVDSIPDVRSF